MVSTAVEQRRVSLRGGMFEVEVLEGGTGSPLLFLHGTAGLEWDGLLERLAQQKRVIAVRAPGFGESKGIEQLDDIHDLVFFYLDLLDELDLRDVVLVGHSLGAMAAAELAAAQPERFRRVVLIAPFGLWKEDGPPVTDFFALTPRQLAAAMYYDDESEPAQALAGGILRARELSGTVDPETAEGRGIIEFFLERARGMQAAARFLWPVPDKGLRKRLHRVRQPVLLLWGERDGIVPPAYAEEFASILPDARIEIVPEASHMVTTEQPERVAEAIEAFLRD